MAERIFIVEDEPLIAFGIEQDLEEAGFEVVGTGSTVEESLNFIESTEMDAVTLDGNLFGESSGPIAEKLTSKKIPFVVVTGYSSGQVGDWINEAPRLNKPYSADKLVALLKKLLN